MASSLEQRVKICLTFLSENGYSEINPNNISIIVTKSDDFFMAQNKNLLLVSKDCANLNDSALTGLLAHELIHFIDYNKSPFIDFLKNLMYQIPFFETKFERAVDLQVVKRGFGRNLLHFLKYHDKHYKKFTEKDGLTKSEIQNLIK